MFAEIIVNIEAPLDNNFHYFVPEDMRGRIQVGHLVEVEFGRRLAQGVVAAFASSPPVEDTKPVISIIDPKPVVFSWQLELAQWLSHTYLAPLNACVRLFLPPGLTRWADITVDINPHWDGDGRLTDAQEAIVELLREKGDMRGRQLKRALPRELRGKWQTAVNQLVNRDILRRGSILQPPRVRPKRLRTAELSAGPGQIWAKALHLGRASKQSEVLHYLAQTDDPLPAVTQVMAATGASDAHLEELVDSGLVQRTPSEALVLPAADQAVVPPDLSETFAALPAPASALPDSVLSQLMEQDLVEQIEQPESLNLAVDRQTALSHIFRLRGGEKYYDILGQLADAAQPVALSDIYEATDSGIYHLRRLAGEELISFGSEEVWRDPLIDRDFVPSEAPPLTSDQVSAWNPIKKALMATAPTAATDELGRMTEREDGEAKPFLLHGVTGSGKTEIYMKAIAHALQRGQRAFVLVPEIALTPQTVRRFASRFPGRVAVMHSRLSDGERYDTWRRARQGLVDIVVGPRSALFTPLPDLGVIVLDEEHDHSYKQEPPIPPPYYHARATAIALGRVTGATVILGSATPDLVTYHHARADRYHLLELPRRVMGHRQRLESQERRLNITSRYAHAEEDPDLALSIPLPPVQVVDLRQELRGGNRSIFSRALQEAVTDVLARGEQAILFLNRRGAATFILCRDCGHVLKCPRCDIPLTYHRAGMNLVCHHCGRSEPPRAECPECGSARIKYFGLGTEELEAQVRRRWPEARTVRWDSDTTAGRDRHEQILSRFVNHEADILVGTQMIAKGLDLPLVTLVGVISADVSLGLPDYTTGERTFQVLTQVAGRAGRGLLGGRVIIQTYKPEHYAIQAAAEHDYVTFYLDEIRFRTQHSYPPFRRLAKLLLIANSNEHGRREAEELAKALRQHSHEKALAATEIIGPAPPFFSRVDGRYRWQILVRSPNPTRLLQDFQVPRPWLVDIDPVSTL